MKWLISCFEPFDQAQSNSSEILWKHLKSKDWGGRARFCNPLPVSYKRAWPALEKEIGDAEGVLVFGQAESRPRLSLECLALNWIDSRIADNDGEQPRLCPVKAGPDVLWSQIPWARLEENEQWSRSYSAGAFVCNHLMYELVNWATQKARMGGFVHVPLLTSQKDPQFESMEKMDHASGLKAGEDIVNFLCGLGG